MHRQDQLWPVCWMKVRDKCKCNLNSDTSASRSWKRTYDLQTKTWHTTKTCLVWRHILSLRGCLFHLNSIFMCHVPSATVAHHFPGKDILITVPPMRSMGETIDSTINSRISRRQTVHLWETVWCDNWNQPFCNIQTFSCSRIDTRCRGTGPGCIKGMVLCQSNNKIWGSGEHYSNKKTSIQRHLSMFLPFFAQRNKIQWWGTRVKAGCSQIMHLHWVPKTQLPLVNAHFKYLRSNVDVKAAVTHSPPRLLDYYAWCNSHPGWGQLGSWGWVKQLFAFSVCWGQTITLSVSKQSQT